MADRRVRIYLTGHLTLDGPSGHVAAGDLPGRQGIRALAYLVVSRPDPVPREALAGAVWSGDQPRARDSSLNAIVSKLRGALSDVGLDGAEALPLESGCYRLRLPPTAWIDVETAFNRLDRAESAVRSGEIATAWSEATVANTILRRPLLPGEDGPWVEAERQRLSTGLVRALECLAEVWLRTGEASLAVAAAEEAVALSPFRESGHRQLMRAHAAADDRGEAVRAYQRCRELLATELGVDPSPATENVYLEILRA